MNTTLILRNTLGFVVVLSLVGFGYIANDRYQYKRFVDSIAQPVKSASLRIDNIARYELGEDTKISYQELFERLDRDIAGIDKVIMDLQLISSRKTRAATEPSVEYLQSAQKFLRAILAKWRKKLAIESAIGRAERSLDDFRDSTSTFASQHALESTKRTMREVESAELEHVTLTADVVDAVDRLKASRERLKGLFDDEILASLKRLQEVSARNSPPPPKH